MGKPTMSTYTSLTYHVIFSTKYRIPRIDKGLKNDLYAYIGGIIRGEKGQLLEIGGTTDHLHILAGFHQTVAVAQMLQHIKGSSSKWINDEKQPQEKFEWQAGYGAFTVSQSQVPTVRHYIQQQEEHHQKRSFKDEFLAFLKRHDIDYDPRYVFEMEHVG
jgi:REP element-mobilizing transposase RayT